MNRRAWIVAPILIGGVAWWAWTSLRFERAIESADRPSSPPPAAASDESVVALPAAVNAPVEAPASARESLVPEPAEVDSAPASAAPIDPDLAHLVGRFVLPDGSPARAATVRLQGWTANQERVIEFGKPEHWADLSSATDDDGRFDIAFDPPRAYQFVLEASATGYCELAWRWGSLPPGETTDVGEQTFVAAGTITGRVVDSSGRPVGGRWTVYANSMFRPNGPGADETRVMGPADSKTGVFGLRGVPPGKAQLRAYSRIANWVDGPTVEVRANETTQADIVYSGPDNTRRIVVIPFSRPYYVYRPEPADITCTRPDGVTLTAEKIRGSSQSHSFADLAPGDYTVAIDSPYFLPWSQSGVQPGERVNAYLKGAASVALTVRDADSDALLEDYGLLVRFEEANFSPNVFQVREPDTEHPPGGVYDGLIPVATTFIVQAAGYAPTEVTAELRAQDRLELEAFVGRGGTVRGRVRAGDGSPASGVSVHLHPHVDDYDPDLMFLNHGSERSAFKARSRSAETDAAGGFQFDALPPGRYDVRASQRALSAEAFDVAVPSAGATNLTLALPAYGAIVGTLVGPTGADYAGLQIAAALERTPTEVMQELLLDRSERIPKAEIDAGGRFRVDAVPAGRTTVLAVTPPRVQRRFNSTSSSPGSFVELGEVRVNADADTHVVFDLTDRFPGALAADVRVNGAAAAEHWLYATRSADDETRDAASGRLDEQGRTRVAMLFAGAWTVTIRSPDGRWSYEHPESISIDPAAEAELRLDVTIAAGRVRVLDAETGHALPSRRVRIGRQTKTTDGQGWLDLELAPGAYALADAGEKGRSFVHDAETTTLDWTARGPAHGEVRLRLAASSDE